MSPSHKGRFGQSVQWQTLSVGVQVLIQLAFVRYLGEYLSKAEWGLLGLVLAFAGVIEIFAQLGVGPSLIQRKKLTQRQVSSAFWFSLLLGGAFATLVYLAAPHVSAFYGRPEMEPLLHWVALSFILAAFALVPRSMLIRRMDFRSLFWSSLVAMTLGNGVFGIWAASNGWGVFAYVGALLIQNGILGLNYWWRSKLKVQIKPHIAEAKTMLKYGLSSTVFNLLNYMASKADLFVLGRLLPVSRAAEVGVYERSVYMMNTPVTVLGKLSDSVLFSGMSGVQDETERLRNIFYGGAYLVAVLVLPGSVILALFAPEIVQVLVGPNLLSAVPIARILTLAILFRSWIKICDAVVRAVDAIASAAFIKAGFCILIAGSAYLGLTLGLRALAAGIVLATLFQFLAMMTLTQRLIQFKWRVLFSLTLPGLRLGLVTLVASLPALQLTEGHWAVRLGLGLTLSFLLTFALAWFRPATLRAGNQDLLAQLAQRLPFAPLKTRWGNPGNIG